LAGIPQSRCGLFRLILAAAAFAGGSVQSHADLGLPREAYGVWDRSGGHPVDQYPYVRGQEYAAEWTAINPARNTFDWTALDSLLQFAYDQNQRFFVKIQPVSATTMPAWMFTAGVPKITCPTYTYGYYLDPEFKTYFAEMVQALGKHLREDVPPHLANMISFVRVDTGATGDEEPYEGTDVPFVPPEYQISAEEWRNYRLWAFDVYDQAFQHGAGPQIPLLFQNIEVPAYRTEKDWVMANVTSGFGAKYGGQVRGHHLSESRNVPDSFKALSMDTPFRFFSVNEMDQTLVKPYFQLNLKLGMYWCAVEQLNAGMTIWDWSNSAMDDAAANDIVSTAEFFNTWAAELDPPTARGGFCIFHEGLASEDTTKFPTAIYGSPASRANTNRYTNICAAYASQGAKMDDLNAATLGQVAQRRVQIGFNDSGWGIWPGNYERFITQIDPDSTSKGLWRVNGTLTTSSHPYDRFARGFDSATGRDTMFFDINDNLLPSAGQRVRLSVDYLDRGTGQFAIRYDAVGNNQKTAFTVTKTGSNTWKTASAIVTDWAFGNQGPNGSDLILVNLDSDDDIFHKLEVTKLAHVQIGTVGKGTVSGRTDAATYSSVVGDDFAESQRLELTVTPAAGWKFTGWSGDLTGSNTRPIFFPTRDARVTATFAPISSTPPSSVPLFSADPIGKSAAPVNGVFSGTLSGNASDPNGPLLTFSKVSGPSWLSIAANGTLSGTPQLADLGLNRWTVQVSSSGGTDTAILLIDVTAPGPNPPSGLSYSSPPVYTKGTAIANLSPSTSGGGVVRYAVTPKLPSGLSMNSITGLISGTPLAPTPATTYTITATNPDGSTTTSLNITVIDIAPSALTYSSNPATYRIDQAITLNTPTNSGGAVVSYAVTPALPTGLSLSTTTGMISGTPTALSTSANYTITATNTGGSTTAQLNIAVEEGGYRNSAVITINDNAAASPYPSAIVVPATAGTVTRVTVTIYGLTHARQNDLDILLVGPQGQKVLLMSDVGGGVSVANVNLTFDDAAAVFLPTSAVSITTGTYKPTDSGATSDTFSAPAPAAPYDVTLSVFNGTNPAGSWSLYVMDDRGLNTGSISGGWRLSLQTTAPPVAAPSALSYSSNPATYTTGSAITDNRPTSSGGAVVSYAVSPALPTGLTLNTSTGVISGTPTTLATAADYTVTATNTGGSTTALVSIAVNDVAPSSLSYSSNPTTYTKDAAIPDNTPTSSGGAVVSYAVSPALPTGLTLNTSTGIISGAPTTLATAVDYTVTASNTGGTTTAALNLAVISVYSAWSTQYQLTQGPEGDDDGDGYSNYFEFVADLIPNNAASVFKTTVTHVSGQANQMAIVYGPIADGRTYELKSSDSLAPGSWTALSGSTSSGLGNERKVIDTEATGTKKYYRVEINYP
jgi:subtilisin-like proprotein convertase family protein